MSRIPYARQSVDDGDIDAVVRVLRSDWLTQGPEIERFERLVAEYCGVEHAVAVSSGTAALHVAALAIGLASGKRLWTSPNSFVASANCALYCGAEVSFVDIDPDDGNMSVSALSDKLRAAERDGVLPDAVMPVQFGGQSCDMAAIGALARRYGFAVIEDASHAIGARHAGRPVGSCLHSDMAVFSFHPVKIITSGEGGIVVTKSRALAERLRRFRTHGVTRENVLGISDPDPWLYWQTDLGYNYRLTDLQAALGANQMKRIDAFVARRLEIAGRYDSAFAGSPVKPLARRPYAVSSFHLYVVQVSPGSRRRIFNGLAASGIHAQVHYIPIHTQPYYRNLGFKPGDYPRAEAYYSGALSLPMFVGLTDDDQRRVVDEILRLAA